VFTGLKELTDSFLDKGVPGFDCILMKDGKQIFRNMGGYRDPEKTQPIDGTERYNVYSATKIITCTAALQLWEKGAFSLEDPLCEYLPEFQHMTVRQGEIVIPAKERIRIKHLFEMTAGFSYNTGSPALLEMKQATQGRCPTREAIRALAKDSLLFEPGTRWEYSLGHDVLAVLVAELSGMSYGEYVRQNIFLPLGMNNTAIGCPDEMLDTLTPLYYHDAATGMAKCLGRTDYARLNFGPEFQSGGAGCISTVEDFIKFLEALRIGDVILKKETIDMMATDRLSQEQRRTYWWGYRSGYGLGVQCPKAGTDDTFFGWSGAAGAEPLVDREHGVTFFYARHITGLNNDYFNDAMVAELKKLIPQLM
jgi:CubicO group peptidase (beta-lactamase class C family)